MKPKLENKLYRDYPLLFVQRHLLPHQSTMYWGIECHNGWYKLLNNLCANIQGYIDLNNIQQVEIVQIKEKFGMLRFYTNFSDNVIDNFIEEAEQESNNTCEICGSTVNIGNTIGWVTTCCENCSKTLNRGWKKHD